MGPCLSCNQNLKDSKLRSPGMPSAKLDHNEESKNSEIERLNQSQLPKANNNPKLE
jgi:hypothetical protein